MNIYVATFPISDSWLQTLDKEKFRMLLFGGSAYNFESRQVQYERQLGRGRGTSQTCTTCLRTLKLHWIVKNQNKTKLFSGQKKIPTRWNCFIDSKCKTPSVDSKGLTWLVSRRSVALHMADLVLHQRSAASEGELRLRLRPTSTVATAMLAHRSAFLAQLHSEPFSCRDPQPMAFPSISLWGDI